MQKCKTRFTSQINFTSSSKNVHFPLLNSPFQGVNTASGTRINNDIYQKTEDPEFYQTINPANIIKQTPDFTFMTHQGRDLPLNLALSAQKRIFLIKKIKKITKKKQRFSFKAILIEEHNINQKSEIKEKYKKKKKKNTIEQMRREIKSFHPGLDSYQQIMAFDEENKERIKARFQRVFPKTSRFQMFLGKPLNRYNMDFLNYISPYKQKRRESWKR